MLPFEVKYAVSQIVQKKTIKNGINIYTNINILLDPFIDMLILRKVNSRMHHFTRNSHNLKQETRNKVKFLFKYFHLIKSVIALQFIRTNFYNASKIIVIIAISFFF